MFSDLLHYLKSGLVAVALFGGIAAYAGEALPYHATLDTQDELDTWSVYDVDGNWEGSKATWCLSVSDCGGDGPASWGNDPNRNAVDNWLVSPALSLEAGTEYVLKFDYYTAYYVDENLEVYLSRSPEPGAEHTLLDKSVLRNYYGGKKNVSIPAQAEAGDYYISFRNAGTGGLMIMVKNVDVDVVSEGSLSGQVTEWSDGVKVPVADMRVHIKGPKEYDAITDADGKYTFAEVRSGDYEVTYFKYGYEEETYPYTVSVDAGAAATHDISVRKMSATDVKGKIQDKNGTPLGGASVTLSGYGSFTAEVSADGTFIIPGVLLYKGSYYAAPYTLTVIKNGFADAVKTVDVRYDYYEPAFDAGSVTMTYNPIAPSAPVLTEGVVSWKAPADVRVRKYDNGSPAADPLGFDGGLDNILAVLFPEPAVVYGAEFYRKSVDYAADPPEKVNVWVFPLDENGEPVGTLAGGKNDVVAPLDAWTSVEFDRPVEMPNGFMLALNTQGYLSVGRDDNPEMAPAHTQLYSNSYNGGYRYFDEIDWAGALMIRAHAERKEAGDYVPQVKYNVYRLLDENREVRDSWTAVATDVVDTQAADASWASLPRGSYRYAVEASYPVDALVSEAVFTDVHHVEQFTDVQVSVGADSRPEDAVGAVVTLKSSDREYAAAVGEDGRVSFTQVWKDVYTLSAAQPGFEFQPVEADLDAQTDYSVALKQILAPVTNIDAVVDENGDVTVKWDLFADIVDDFDGPEYADFEINPAGRHGWSYLDGDAHATYGFGSSTFPGMRSPMAALVFNYKSVDPELGFRTSRSGDRALGFFCPSPDEIDGGMKLNTSDDYLISPELAFHKPFTLRLYAMTYENQDGRLERIRAGYSLSGKSPEDFVWDEKGLQEVPEREWTEFSWNFPAEARYVALNSSSDDVFLLLVDDLSIGTGILHSGQEPARGSFNGYTFSLDGAPAVALAETSRKISDLTPGEHKAAVCKVYNGGTSAPLEVTFSTTDGLGSVSAARSGLSVRLDPENVLRISGEFDSAAVCTPAGASVRHINAAATDLSDLAAGVYIVSAQGPSGRATARVIIK